MGTAEGGGGIGGREGDWDCNGCRNRNYAFRSFCNRCKQPRLFVDTKTPSDSKWLPRIGDWICTGCTNNNYASREKCKKCGQPKEVAAMPAIAIPGASVPTHPNYFARAQGSYIQRPLSLNSGWPPGRIDNYGIHSYDPYNFQRPWSMEGNFHRVQFSGQPYQLNITPNDWRLGDWICPCGYHNYSSRVQCKKCSAPMVAPSLVNSAAVGTKRIASEEFVHNWDSKRQNAGRVHGLQKLYPGVEPFPVPGGSQLNSIFPSFPSGSSLMASNFQTNAQLLPPSPTPFLLGKGAKQWRDGDWMCSNCNNHNYASRAECNRCKTQREAVGEPVSVALSINVS